MGVSLATLEARLTALVPALNGVPADYEQLAKDAVDQLSTDVPMTKMMQLAVVSGTAAYDLPADFRFLISLEGIRRPDGIIIGNSGLIPVSSTWEEYYDVEGNRIVFTPTPTYSLSRAVRYGAGHVLDGSEIYPRLTENGARIALLYGQHLALMAQANTVAPAGWKYQIGDEMVDKSGQAGKLREQADGLLKQYQSAVKPLKGYGMQGAAHGTYE
ncbi:MAG: hypothetical protein AB7R40_22195 [Nitrospiraceae bacterium]